MQTWKLDQLQTLTGGEDVNFLNRSVVELVRGLGFEHCSFGVRTHTSVMHPRFIMLSNYPQQWQAKYIASDYISIDPTVSHCHRSLMPVLWHEDLFAQVPSFWEEARSYGLHHGWAQSAQDLRGVESMLTLSRSNESISSLEFYTKAGQISWLCNLLHTVMAEKLLSSVNPLPPSHLSAREVEILKWSAEGKTASETALILNLKTRTVNFHMANVIKKFGVANKTAAVVHAALKGLL